MADLVAIQNASLVSFLAATAKTIIQIKAAANQRVKAKEIGISFNGAVNTNTPVQVQLMLQTTAGTASAGTPVATDGDIAETIQTGTQITFTAEPTYSSVIREWLVHPQTGLVIPLSLAKPPVLKGGARWGLVINAPQAVSASAYFEFEE